VHAIVRHALEDARRWDLVRRNVADQADPPRQTSGPVVLRTWTAAELRAFLEGRRDADDRLYPLWLLAASTGMRRGELLGLTWNDVDLDAGRVAVRRARVAVGYTVEQSDAKTKRGRRNVALDTGTVWALREHRKRQAADRLALGGLWPQDAEEIGNLVFRREDGLPLHPDAISKTFNSHVAASGPSEDPAA
jgi:integrase